MKPLLRSGRRLYSLNLSRAAAAVWAAAATGLATDAAAAAGDSATPTAATNPVPHVCIIGGGIGGASAAYFLRDAAPTGVRLSLFERRPHLGGRLASLWLPPIVQDGSGIGGHGEDVQLGDDAAVSTAAAGVDANGTTAVHVEVGGSIIHPRNRLMAHFVDDVLRLPRRSAPDQSMGLWDGHCFVLRLDAERPVANVGRLLWRYGLSLPRMQAAVGRLLASFDAIYGSGAGVPVGGHGGGDGGNVGGGVGGGWRVGVARLQDAALGLFGARRGAPRAASPPPTTVAGLLSPRGDGLLVGMAARRLGAYATSAGLRPPLTAELMPAITRVNYGQEAEGMAALAGAVGLAGSGGGLWAVAGGNAQVPAGLIARAGATVHAAEAVTRVATVPPAGGGGGATRYVLTSVAATADAVGVALATAGAAARDGPPPSTGATAGDVSGPAIRAAPPLMLNRSRTTACDAVVVATPLELSGGLVVGGAAAAGAASPPPPPPPPPARLFRACVATFVRGEVEPTYWGLPRDCCGCVPDVVLTTAAAPAGRVPFTSLSALSRARPPAPRACAAGPDRAVYKLFSPAPLTSADLGRLFRAHTVLAVVPWAAYPVYDPPPTLGSFLLGGISDIGGGGGGRGGDGGGGGRANAASVAARLVYVNAIESAASAMEMSALGGKAAAALVANALGLGAAPAGDGRERPPPATPPPPAASANTEL